MAVPHSLTFMPYIMGSILGQLPGNLLGVYFGKNIKGLGAMLRGENTSPGQIAYNVVSVASCRAVPCRDSPGQLAYNNAQCERRTAALCLCLATPVLEP